YVYWNTGDFARALGEMKAAIEYGMQYPSQPNASNLTASARHDITSIYAFVGDPAKAFDFLRPLSGDGDGEQQRTFKMMNELGRNYLDAGRNKAAVVVYIDLIRRNPGAPACAYLAQLDAGADAAKRKPD